MNWSNWSDFVAMGGYGLYVWGSFGVAALGIALEVSSLLARARALRRAPPEASGRRGALEEVVT